jgi:hypothetical protein
VGANLEIVLKSRSEFSKFASIMILFRKSPKSFNELKPKESLSPVMFEYPSLIRISSMPICSLSNVRFPENL